MMTRAMASDALLLVAIDAYDRLAADVDAAGDPELGLATTYVGGRRALAARARAEAWLVPPSVVARIEGLIGRLPAVAEDDGCAWLESFPNTVLAILERRVAEVLAAPSEPRRRWIDRVADRHIRLGADPASLTVAVTSGRSR